MKAADASGSNCPSNCAQGTPLTSVAVTCTGVNGQTPGVAGLSPSRAAQGVIRSRQALQERAVLCWDALISGFGRAGRRRRVRGQR